MTLPYENASSGAKAMEEIQKILQAFGCSSFGHMTDFAKGTLIVQFKYREIPITVEASFKGYAAAWIRKHPWNSNYKHKKDQHEAKALDCRRCGVEPSQGRRLLANGNYRALT